MIENSKFNQNSKLKIQNFKLPFFLTIFILQLTCWLFLTLAPQVGQAADPAKFTPQVGIGTDFQAGKSYSPDGSTALIAQYIRAIYKYAIGIVGILAAVVLMVGGVMWIIAGGSATMIGEAKAWIGASLTGLTLALLSYLILATVNPALVELRTTAIKPVKENSLNETCQWAEVPNDKFCKDVPGLDNKWITSDSTKCGNKKETATILTECCCKKNELTPTTVDITKKHMGCVLEPSLSGTLQLTCKEVLGEGSDVCSSDQDCLDNQKVCCLQDRGGVLWNIYNKCEILTNKECKTISGAEANPNSTCEESNISGWKCIIK